MVATARVVAEAEGACRSGDPADKPLVQPPKPSTSNKATEIGVLFILPLGSQRSCPGVFPRGMMRPPAGRAQTSGEFRRSKIGPRPQGRQSVLTHSYARAGSSS
jgi:hypothetical protein